ncbi:MAG: nicotinate-nucleotide diphosphorylase (carboxylating) [Bacteroidetes bacterium]|nr:MAG: nicotinate-nucleotide diphosphorylase (carboxylating) [Bacteroidota bacterium]
MHNFDEHLRTLVDSALKEDIGDGDHSTLSCINADAKGKAALHVKQDCIIAGIEVAEKIFRWMEPSSKFVALKKDGEHAEVGEWAFEIEARVHTILKCERLVLNCMQRMSGIAGLTRLYVDKIKGFKSQILDTRKTTPNFRLLEKEAVRIGGGHNHRFGLYDMIMLKDNHIDYCGGIEKAIDLAARYVQTIRAGLKIEIETRNLDDVKRVVTFGKVDRIMLDNFSTAQIVEALKIINGKFETEASGGIHLENVTEYAATGVDFISIGALIHQATSVDFSLKAEES